MTKPKRPISEELDEAIAIVKAMAAGKLPISEKQLRWVWIVDHTASHMLLGPRRKWEETGHPIRQRLPELMEAMNINPKVKRACLATWARHSANAAPDPEQGFRLFMSILDDLMTRDETLDVVTLISKCSEIA